MTDDQTPAGGSAPAEPEPVNPPAQTEAHVPPPPSAPAPPPPYRPGYTPAPGYGVPPHWVAQIPPPQRQRSSAAATVVLVLVLLLVGALVIGAFSYLSSQSGGAGPSLGTAHVGLIAVEGIIRDGGEGGLFAGPPGARGIMKQLRAAGRDDDVRSVLLLINSPGGSAAASAAMYEEIKRLREEKHKPVVACMTDVAASGGYYIASACDKIVAQGSTTTGSIGVIFGGIGYYGLMKKLGLTDETITAGKYKAMGHGTRPMSPEERAIVVAMLDDIYNQFLQAVSEGRKMDLSKVRELAQGRVYTGSQAFKLGLVDQLGNYYDALKLAGELGGIKGEPKLKTFGQTKSLLDELTSTRSGIQRLMSSEGIQTQLPLQGPLLLMPYRFRVQPLVPVPVGE